MANGGAAAACSDALGQLNLGGREGALSFVGGAFFERTNARGRQQAQGRIRARGADVVCLAQTLDGFEDFGGQKAVAKQEEKVGAAAGRLRDCLSLFTPQPNVLQVPNPVQGQILNVVYQARHPELKYDDLEACIEVPFVLEGALSAYIAHRVFHHMNGAENSQKSAEYLTLYESICTDVTEKDLVNSSTSTGRKFYDRGFV